MIFSAPDKFHFFCAKPFDHFEVNFDGNVYCCCPAWLGKPIGNLLDSDPHEIWNSKAAEAIRRSILDFTFAHCSTTQCPLLGFYRQLMGKMGFFGKLFHSAAVRKITRQGLKDAGLPKVFVPAYDWSCNLQCKSCRSKPIVLRGNEFEQAQKIQNTILESNILKDVELVILSGQGDPFASRLYTDFLKHVTLEKYRNMSINIQTNGLLLTPEKWEEIQNAHYAIDSIYVSIDAASETCYKLNRYPGNFSKLLSNLEFISELRKKELIRIFRTNFVVQRNNYKEIIPFIKLGEKFGVDHIYFSALFDMNTYAEDEYETRTVNDPNNPEYDNFINEMTDAVAYIKENLKNNDKKNSFPIVNFGNLLTSLPDHMVYDLKTNCYPDTAKKMIKSPSQFLYYSSRPQLTESNP